MSNTPNYSEEAKGKIAKMILHGDWLLLERPVVLNTVSKQSKLYIPESAQEGRQRRSVTYGWAKVIKCGTETKRVKEGDRVALASPNTSYLFPLGAGKDDGANIIKENGIMSHISQSDWDDEWNEIDFFELGGGVPS